MKSIVEIYLAHTIIEIEYFVTATIITSERVNTIEKIC